MNLRACAILLMSAVWWAAGPDPVQAQKFRVFIGTYTADDSTSKGIYSCVLDVADGSLSEPSLAAEAVNPSFLAIHPNGQYLYCVNEISEGPGRPTGTATAFVLDAATGALERINSQTTEGGVPCHCNVDATGRWLLVANYMGGNTVVLPIGRNGGLGPIASNVQHTGSSVDPQRQDGPHAHSVNLSADNQFAYAADLGIDRLLIFRFDADTGIIEPNDPFSVAVSPGGGPRHFSLTPDGKYAYANNELSATVTAFRRDSESGALAPIQEISTLPADFDGRKSTAECVVHPTGKFLYVSNRGHDSIAVYTIDEQTGLLVLVEIQATEGQEPRNFCLDPTGQWLLAGNQQSDSVVVFAVDADTGALTATDHRIAVGRPVCFRMMALP